MAGYKRLEKGYAENFKLYPKCGTLPAARRFQKPPLRGASPLPSVTVTAACLGLALAN